MDVNVKDYLSNDEIKDICQIAVRERVHKLLESENDIERFLSNTSYHFVWDAINERTPENMLEKISSKIPEIVEKLSAWDVFRQESYWESTGWALLREALNEAKPLIKAKAIELIQKIDMDMIREVIMDQIVIDNLKEKNNG